MLCFCFFFLHGWMICLCIPVHGHRKMMGAMFSIASIYSPILKMEDVAFVKLHLLCFLAAHIKWYKPLSSLASSSDWPLRNVQSQLNQLLITNEHTSPGLKELVSSEELYIRNVQSQLKASRPSMAALIKLIHTQWDKYQSIAALWCFCPHGSSLSHHGPMPIYP